MRIPIFAFRHQPDFPQRATDGTYPVFSAVVPHTPESKRGWGYRIYKRGPGDFEGTYQPVTFAERQEDGEHHWIGMGPEKTLGAATWADDRNVWSCETEPPNVEAHRSSMDATE